MGEIGKLPQGNLALAILRPWQAFNISINFSVIDH